MAVSAVRQPHSARPAPIRGRADELKTVTTLVDKVAAGRGGVLVIEGPPGIGKSRLLTETFALAAKAKVRVLFGEAFEYQQSVPFFSLFMATLRADPPVGDAEALRRLGASADLRYWVVRDLHAAIRQTATQTPLAILLEDIHWADNATLVALRSLAVPNSDSPVLWVFTARAGAGGPAVRETLAALEHQGATILRLAPMAPAAVAEFVQDTVRARVTESLLRLAGKAHGNPFLLTELLQGLEAEDRLDVRGGAAVVTGDKLPRRLTETMHQRLDQLSNVANQVVRVAAVLPDRFSAGLLAAMLERRPSALVPSVEEAVRADLLVEDGELLRFRHDLLRDAARESLPQSLRRAMERQAASVMLDMGAAPAEVATQLARSAEVGDQAAVAALREAAQAVANSDPGAASDLSLRALELQSPQDPDHGSLVTETVMLLNRATRYDEAQKLASTTLSDPMKPDEEAEILLRLRTAITDTTVHHIEENRRALLLPHLSSTLRSRHRAWLAYNLTMYGQQGSDSAAADEAASAAVSTGDPESRILSGVALAYLDCVNGYPGRALRRVEDLQPLTPECETTVKNLAACHLANLLAVSGRFGDAATVVAAGKERSENEHDGMALYIWALMAGVLHAATGRLSAARAATESLPPPRPPAATFVSAMRMFTLADVAARTGDRKLLVEHLSEARDAYSGATPAVRRGAACALGLAAWQRDDAQDAVRWLGGDSPILMTPFLPSVLDQLILAARVASSAGDAGLRAHVLQATEVLEGERPQVPLFAAVTRHARGILERDAQTLIAAAESLRSGGRPLLFAGAAEDAGCELLRVRRDDDALGHLNAAFDAYGECGATTDARRIARVLRAVGVERRIVTRHRGTTGWDSLTDSELTVVQMIAEGATNRSVAQQLRLSPHTVKTHVRNAFAKLGITSRAQLAQFMRSRD